MKLSVFSTCRFIIEWSLLVKRLDSPPILFVVLPDSEPFFSATLRYAKAGYKNINKLAFRRPTSVSLYRAAPVAALPVRLALPRPDLTSSSCSIPV